MASMENLIPVINKLQEVFSSVGGGVSTDLPQIVVVGAQSSGKSSVLENIVGRDFLPRGSGIVTRRPLILQLERAAKDTAEWGAFAHKPGVRFSDFSEIRTEIAAETDRVAGGNLGVSSEPIMLRIHSPNVVPLTLVDLPGLTKNPVGDQPSDIEFRLRSLVLDYVRSENAIILAVTAANTDLANSDALNVAREVDPSGLRTLGVLTKLDLMDAGTSAADILQGSFMPLRLGYIAIVNRSQADINSRRPITEALEAESQFFRTHPVYSKIAHRCGTAYLASTLSRLLLTHIKAVLPSLRELIVERTAAATAELTQLGTAEYDSLPAQAAGLLQALTVCSNEYVAAINGRARELNVASYQGGARISYILHTTFSERVRNIDPLDGLTVTEIRTAISNATGAQRSLFVPEVSFELLVKKQIKGLRHPALQCVDFVQEELEAIGRQVAEGEVGRFPALKDRVRGCIEGVVAECVEATRALVSTLIDMELAYINTSHPDFSAQSLLRSSILGEGGLSTSGRRLSNGSSAAAAGSSTAAAATLSAPAATYGTGGGAANSGSTSTTGGGGGGGGVGAALAGSLRGVMGRGGMTNFFGGDKDEGKGGAPSTSSGGVSLGAASSSTAASKAQDKEWELVRPPSVLLHDRNLSERERMECNLVQELLISYFNIVKKNLCDSVPKAIMLTLVNKVTNGLQSHLVASLYREDLFPVLMVEADNAAVKRRRCREELVALKAASDILASVRDTSL